MLNLVSVIEVSIVFCFISRGTSAFRSINAVGITMGYLKFK